MGFDCDPRLVLTIHSAIILQNSDLSLVLVDLVIHSPLLPLLVQMLYVHFYEVLDDIDFLTGRRWSSLKAAIDHGSLLQLQLRLLQALLSWRPRCGLPFGVSLGKQHLALL